MAARFRVGVSGLWRLSGAAGVCLLPRPLTILVLGFAWVQSTSPIVALVLLSLSAGTATTISVVALLATVCALLYRCRSDASTARP